MDLDDEITRANRAKRGSPFLNTDQAAAYLKLSGRQLKRLRRAGTGGSDLPDLPATQIAAYRTPLTPAGRGLDRALARQFPNLTVIDVSAQLNQVQGVLDQVVVELAVEGDGGGPQEALVRVVVQWQPHVHLPERRHVEGGGAAAVPQADLHRAGGLAEPGVMRQMN